MDFFIGDDAMPHAAIFIDKDGTLVDNVPYNVNPAHVRLAIGVRKGLSRLAETDYRLFIISNQPGVALGFFEEAALEELELHIAQLFLEHGCTLGGFYYCPHEPEPTRGGLCECRKPQPGMLLKAAREHDLCLNRSWFIGDILDDVEAGRRAGCRTIHIDNGNETEWKRSPLRMPHFTATDFGGAVEHILERISAPLLTPAL